jgi:hypothetical protein
MFELAGLWLRHQPDSALSTDRLDTELLKRAFLG